MLIRSTTLVLLLLSIQARGLAQSDTMASHYAKSITEAELKAHLSVIASDAYEGRDTGKRGQKMAAAYLKEKFVAMGIPPVPPPYNATITDGYFLPYELIEEHAGGISLQHQGTERALLNGIIYFNEVLNADLAVNELIYLGDGSRLPREMPLTGKTVLVNGSSFGSGGELFGRVRSTIDPIRKAGAAAIILYAPQFAELANMVHTDDTDMKLAYEAKKKETPTAGQLIIADGATTSELIGSRAFKKLKRKRSGTSFPTQLTLKVKPKEERVTAENVLAFIEGSDRKDEVVVMTAHYDHVGMEDGVVYNGADDDGTGTVALLEIAQAFAQAKAEGHGPRRSILIMPVSGEEKGLLGSRYYSDHPVFPIANTVADLNIDMIGRVDSAHANSAPYVYVIGSDRLSSGLHAANEAANAHVGLELDYSFNAESDPNRFYYRSDHYNFARKGIPSVFYFSGVHEDYHQPGDDVEKIRFDLLRKRALLVFYTAWSLANADERIKVDRPSK